MKNDKMFWKTSFDIAPGVKKDEQVILQEVTDRLEKKVQGVDMLHIRRIDIRDGKAVVFFEGQQPAVKMVSRPLAGEGLMPEGIVAIKEEDILALP